MMVGKACKLTLAGLVLMLSVGFPKAQAISVNNTEINQSESKSFVLVNNHQTTAKKPILIAQNDTYVGADGDFEIRIPGVIQENKNQKLVSYSNNTQTVYVIHYRDLPSEVSYLPGNAVAQVLRETLKESFASEGKIISTTDLTIADKYPGIEILVLNNDGTKGKYRSYIVQRRMYIIGAVTPKTLTGEVDEFLDSFGIYTNRLR